MADIYVYGYATSIIRGDFTSDILLPNFKQTATSFSTQNTSIGSSADKLIFIGDYTSSSGNISGGTITEMQVDSSTGNLLVDVKNISVPLSNSGGGFSFNTGSFLAPGSNYHDATGNSSLQGYGNDTYYAGAKTVIQTGGGVNTINADSTGVLVQFTGRFADYTLASGTAGTLTVIDSTLTRNGYDIIVGTATLKFYGDAVPTVLQDINGQFSLSATASQAVGYLNKTLDAKLNVSDSALNVAANLDGLQALYAGGQLASLALTDLSTPNLTITAAQLTADSGVLQTISSPYLLNVSGLTVKAALAAASGAHIGILSISDSAADVVASLDALESLVASAKLGGITLTDGGIATLAVTPAQTVSDHGVLVALTGNAALSVTAGTVSQTITGVANHALTVIFSGAASQYTVTTGAGGALTVSNGTVTDHITNATALQFSDVTDIVASQTPSASGGVSSFQVSTLYSAVLARTPDPAGLAFYENYAAANPGVPITTYATWFLQSPEYTAKHSYAQTAAGDTQFVEDTYQNLLHRAPEAGADSYYLTNVIQPMLKGLTPGSTAYANAELAAHAQMLAYFSQSPEFQGDVQVTAQNASSAQHWLVLT